MTQDYRKQRLDRLGFEFEDAVTAKLDAHLTLSHKEVLGIVQASYDALGADDPQLIAAKRAVFEEVAQGKLARAIRTAIIAAGKRQCNCCS